jgi:hypothetical protein
MKLHRRILNIHKYLFYRAYSTRLNYIFGTSPKGNGFYFILLLITLEGILFNIILCNLLLLVSKDIYCNNSSNIILIAVYFPCIVSTVISYYTFIYKDKYLEYISLYENESNKEKKVGTIKLILYYLVVCSISVLLLIFDKSIVTC